MNLPNGREVFRTDVDISGPNNSRDQRELQRWGSSTIGLGSVGGGLEDGDGALETSSSGANLGLGGPSGKGKWDQFATNERLFGAKTDFNEEMYTTKLDRSTADFREREIKAIRLAQEIQSVSGVLPCHEYADMSERVPLIMRTLRRNGDLQ